ncbi:MAG: Hsp70 family protein, partial [Lachnospiraceae bacterium]|nr:Hsp70 family protein [Lachnospiraceae bacterium]
EESHILVYDLGGGTFDVTLLEMFDGVLEVKASSGDNQLGGKDFDQKLIDYLTLQFEKKNGVSLRRDPYAMVKLKESAEWCKKELSREESCRVLIPMIAEKKGLPLSLDETVTRAQFEEMSADLIERTHRPIDVVMADSGISREEIDFVLLAGGSTRLPMVAADLEEYLGIRPSTVLNPDYAVAEGAAIQAGLLEGTLSEESILMTDVNPYTLGVRVTDGFSWDRMSVVIPRNVTIPVTRTEQYFTNSDYQREAKIEVYQGESSVATHNHFLGEFEIGGIPPREAGEEKIEVEFSYNLNGMLNVSAKIVSTGEQAQIEINLQGQETEDAIGTAARIDVSGWKEAPDAKSFRAVIRRAERLLKKRDESDLLDEADFAELEETIYLLKKAVLENDLEEAEALELDLMDFLED